MWSVQVRIARSSSLPGSGTSRGLGFRVIFRREASRLGLLRAGACARAALVREEAVGVAVPEAGGVGCVVAIVVVGCVICYQLDGGRFFLEEEEGIGEEERERG